MALAAVEHAAATTTSADAMATACYALSASTRGVPPCSELRLRLSCRGERHGGGVDDDGA